jgi:hypothetical protein
MIEGFEGRRVFKFELDQDENKFPDDWMIEEGEGFQVYHRLMLDESKRGFDDEHCLKIDFSGGRSGIKSIPLNLEKRYAYNLNLRHRSNGLDPKFKHLLSFGLRAYDVKKKLIRTFTLSDDNFADSWTETPELRIEVLPPGTHRCVLFVHIEGRPAGASTLLLDEVVLEASPRIRFETGRKLNTFGPDEALTFSQWLEGLELGQDYEHRVEVLDFMGQRKVPLQKTMVKGTMEAVDIKTNINSRDAGVFYVNSSLLRKGKALVVRKDIVARRSAVGDDLGNAEFGVLIGRPRFPFEPLLDAMALLGTAVSKLELLPKGFSLAEFSAESGFEDLNPLLQKWAPDRGFSFLGVLNLPPEDTHLNPYRPAKHVVTSLGSHPEQWTPVLDNLMLKYGNVISDWQIGQDRQVMSQAQLEKASKVISHLRKKTEWMEIVLPGFESEIKEEGFSKNLYVPSELTDMEMMALLDRPGQEELTVTLELGSSQELEQLHIIESMVRRITLLKSAKDSMGAPLVKRLFIDRLAGVDSALMTEDYHPQTSFFAAKTLIHWMRGAEHLGAFQNPDQEVRSFVFGRGSEAFVMLWRQSGQGGLRPETKEATYHLGADLKICDLMGNRALGTDIAGVQRIPIGATPLMVITPHRQLWETMLSFKLLNRDTKAKVELQPQSLGWVNRFSKEAKFDLQLTYPQGWEVLPNRFSSQVLKSAKAEASYQIAPSPLSPLNLGVAVDVELEVSLANGHHKVKVYREDVISSKLQIELQFYKDTQVSGALQCVVDIHLKSDALQASSFAIAAQLPNGEVMETFFKRVQPGERRQNTLFILQGERFIGQDLTLTARENIGQRYLNLRFPIQPDYP